jgi:hypothetical protein
MHLRALALLLCCIAPALAGEIGEAPAWSTLLHEDHRERVDTAASTVDALMAELPADADPQARADIVALRARTPTRIAADENLGGAWRVRSLQIQSDAIYAYPWFKARIETDEFGWRFAKTSGSQRRSGRLWRDAEDPSRLIFLGASTVNDDPELAYSDARSDTGPQHSDSVGVLHRLGPAHLVMILDAHPGESAEIYELRR